MRTPPIDTGRVDMTARRNYEGANEDSATLLSYQVIIPGFPAVVVGERIDWGQDPFGHPSWHFRFHSLTWLLPYLPHRRDVRVRRRIVDIARQWSSGNPRNDPPSDFSWSDHATALRTEVYLTLADVIADAVWLRAVLRDHADALADPDFYSGSGNHALDQDIALHKAGCAIGDDALIELAEQRMATLAIQSIDEEGVTNEGAVNYQRYNYERYRIAQAQIEKSGRSVPAGLLRHTSMPVMLAHATRPDGYYEQIGDTFLSRPFMIRGTTAEYAATAGASGPRPDRRVGVFSAGYVFGRSGWGEERPFTEENFYSIRFGPGGLDQFHRHADHTSITWHPRGVPVLIDSGTDGYQEDDYRHRYCKAAEGHNVVVVRGERMVRTRDTQLEMATIRNRTNEEAFHLTGGPYVGVSRERHVLVIHDPPAIVVRDELISPRQPRTFDQLWHFHPDLEVRIDGNRVQATGPATAVTMIQLGGHQDITMVAGQREPLQGWVSFSEGERLPTPTVIASAHGEEATFVTVLAAGTNVEATWLDDASLSLIVDGQTLRVALSENPRTF